MLIVKGIPENLLLVICFSGWWGGVKLMVESTLKESPTKEFTKALRI